jgi:sugar (pentulose or hexulose) kinase
VGIQQSDLAGICVDSTACSVLALDKDNQPLRKCLLWCDARYILELGLWLGLELVG